MTIQQLVSRDTQDQYNTFELMWPYFLMPRIFYAQSMFLAIRSEDLPPLIAEFYQLNPKVMRDVIGRKLPKRIKDTTISSISERTNVPASICKRQVGTTSCAFTLSVCLTICVTRLLTSTESNALMCM
jgi:hypothetical protein